MPEKQLSLSLRSAFFSDPFFSDLHPSLDSGLEQRLASFSARSLGVSGEGLGDAAHNIQVSATNEKFQVQLELPGFAPEDFSLKTKGDVIIVEAIHESNNEEGEMSNSRKFTREFKMPSGVVTPELSSTYSGSGILTVSAPRKIEVPEGAEVTEAMKAQSQAYVTEDGTKVKKDEKASSQSIATSSQSEDGSTTSSFKSSSSSSSSSTMMSSGGSMPQGMGGGGMSLFNAGGGMEDMMSKMMNNMGSMDMGGSSIKMGSSSTKKSSSSFSSSSSSMMSSKMSSMLGGDMPPLRGMDLGGMTIEEMPGTSTPPSSTAYTVTSPPPSTTTYKVGAGADYSPRSVTEPDTSVLLQCKTGSDFKLVLNMQQYGPEDINIKLGGSKLTIEAHRDGETFQQKHTIPENIDLDAMTSSFSSDGVLVIKAPKLQ